MRILHTSDWHLGQHFIGKTRQAEHQAFIAWLVEQVGRHQADALIVAGDIFDTGAPPSYARELYNQLVVALHDAGVQLLLLGGNHDSAATLGESRPLLSYLSATVVPAVEDDPADQVRLLRRRDGQPGAIVCAVPFIRPRDVLQSQAGQSAEEKQLSLRQAIHDHYQRLYRLACARREELGLALPIVATGHLTTVGASASESVREIYVGALEAFPTSAFPPADYIALGHIHRPQKVGGLEHIRYCGSPIALSFDEAGQQKEVLLVELDGAGLRSVTPLPVPIFQPLLSLKGDLARLAEAIPAAARQADAGLPLWLEVVVRGDDYVADLPARIQQMTEGLPLEVLRIRRERGDAAAALQAQASETLGELTPYEVFARRLALEDIDDELQRGLETRYRSVVESLREGEA
ncbi:exonuclease subunit SbcD [Chromobacterium subtsugae]|uniref:Nuclease SbcCD subunit D n=1 Tax=Chromobacterium subtsugae TaxID=251747 RepID=A0ABS7FF69_9NEIS|nr:MULTISPECIES: exonuclease subunit SbcD [Chromobacterium]KUM05205.1 exonuclease SbcD [Chromobacterium subtsugae]KZE87654.1 exonuclease sbcCD subunit D [Chromobacterium sp. F49]MBW7566970.1 exonuclease subunit SbcD [Chromobacterium subtsugae]MBW8288711.1 exonuclease subunit SbcD [Chromobacterium subtsugae]WSE90064.1 exonuclease subunit SbcD [Chromobacterium subtsugae]